MFTTRHLSRAMRTTALSMLVGASALSFCGSAADAQSAVLRTFAGSWSGSGTLSHETGATERIRCRASYALSGSDSLQQRLDCRSDTTTFDLTSTISVRGDEFSGDWTESTRGARGTISGTIRQNLIEGQVLGPSFSASVAIAQRGARQTVVIRSRGSDITEVSMVLTRSR